MNLLKQLELDELSLVDRPANAQAKVALFKRDSNEDDMEKAYKMTEEQEKNLDNLPPAVRAKIRENMDKGMSYNEAMKMAEADMKKSDDDVADVDEQDILQAAVDTLKLENERLRKSLIDNGFVIKSESVEKKEEVEMIEVEGVSVAKSDIPAPVLKALEAAKVEKRQAELRKSAEAELPHFDVEVAMQLLDVIKGDEKVLEALKGADAAFAAAMDEVGEKAVDADMLDPQAKLDKMVEEHANAHGVNKYAAFDAVAKTAEGKALIAKTYEKDE
jgi:regulator of replication initiation timing